MNELKTYQQWLSMIPQDTILHKELISIKGNEPEIQDRFYRDLEFGTGGLRGILGAGTNRMNIYTVSKATQGLADYLNSISEAPSVCIAYDTRNMSKEFAAAAAEVFCANGVKTCLFEDVRPTPMLSYAVRHKGADAGIVITASHNPKEYNGYKVYDLDGGQITDAMAAEILDKINAVDVFKGVKRVLPGDTEFLSLMGEEVDAAYYEQVKSLVLRPELLKKKSATLKILYSPLHGSGNVPVRRVLKELGFSQTDIVPEQEKPDGNFPTAPYPNPEEPSVFALAKKLAEKTTPDLIFATDPDCDRIGVLVKDDTGDFSILTGNQVGVLLCDYILSAKKEKGILPKNAAVIKTIVTTHMAAPVCKAYGAELVDTLTGFKYIGEKIGQWEQSGQYSFQFGFEESYGYLAGEFTRDKDAVIAAVLIAEMTLWHKENGRTLYDALEELFKRYGYFEEKLLSFHMPGVDGQEKIASIIAGLRKDYSQYILHDSIAFIEDYKLSLRRDCPTGIETEIEFPKSNVLKFVFKDDFWMVLRPSGTEPKMKAYIGASGLEKRIAQKRLDALEATIAKILC